MLGENEVRRRRTHVKVTKNASSAKLRERCEQLVELLKQSNADNIALKRTLTAQKNQLLEQKKLAVREATEKAAKETTERLTHRIKKLSENKKTVVRRTKVVVRIVKQKSPQRDLSKEIKLDKEAVFNKGKEKGRIEYKKELRKEGLGLLPKNQTVSSLAQMCILATKLSRTLGIPYEYIAYFLWCGQYETFSGDAIRQNFRQVARYEYQNRLRYMKQKGYLHKLATKDGCGLWALTPLGAEIYRRMRAYIGKFLTESQEN